MVVGVVLDEADQKPPLTATPDELDRLLTCIENDILPLTQKGVSEGNKVFGAAIIDNSTGQTVVAQTNAELTCPLFHGEVHAIVTWSNLIPPSDRGTAAQTSTFLSTHEPCCMCISSIIWAGFTNCYYLFSYDQTASQGIPHDIHLMHELWNVASYRKQNKFCATACLVDLVEAMEDDGVTVDDDDDDNNKVNDGDTSGTNSDGGKTKKKLKQRIDNLVVAYNELSNQYHTEKANNENNSLAFG